LCFDMLQETTKQLSICMKPKIELMNFDVRYFKTRV